VTPNLARADKKVLVFLKLLEAAKYLYRAVKNLNAKRMKGFAVTLGFIR
jgi:hypothetical protein